jgi:hypothetical protein
MQDINNLPETLQNQSKNHRFKCKVRDDQEVGRWKKEEHENFIKGKLQPAFKRVAKFKLQSSKRYLLTYSNICPYTSSNLYSAHSCERIFAPRPPIFSFFAEKCYEIGILGGLI